MEVSTTNDLAPLSEASISELISELHEKCEIERYLPGGGYLHMSDELPYLVIYRLKDTEEDKANMRFVLSEASFLILGNEDFEGYQRLIYSLGETLASRFKTFLMLEVYAGENNVNRFKIKGPAEKLPATLKILRTELDKVNNSYSMLSLDAAEIEDTEERQSSGTKPLLTLKKLRDAGCVLLGLEIPPVYRTVEGEEFPVLFRKFKEDFVVALHKGIYEFIRVQTSSGATSYQALGQKSLKKEVLDIDRQLSAIETSYRFLWLISPVNIRQIKQTFFASNFEKVLNYHYRLLPIDPDVLKRKLYNLEIENIDDPALSFLFREKREELDLQINMLNTRGNKNFFYNSLMLYRGIDENLVEEALLLLKEVAEESDEEPKNLLKAQDFKYLAQDEFEFFRKQDPKFTGKVHIRDDVNILMVSHGELYLPSDYKMNATESIALVQHEIGTHMLTYYNGLQQPLKQLSTGLTNYDILQEGLAVMSEYFVGGLTPNRMRTLAGRVLAASARKDGADFQEIFGLLYRDHGFTSERAFSIVSRVMQGSGFIKDVSYLKGMVALKNHLEDGGAIEPLLTGKFALEHLPIIHELLERRVLEKKNLHPRYLNTEETKVKLNRIRKGISLSQMVNE